MLRLKSATFAVAALVVAAGVTGTALVTLAGEGDTANRLTARQKASSPQTQPKASQPETPEIPDPFVIADAVYPEGQTLRIPLGDEVFAEVVALTDGEVFWSPSGQLLERPAFDRVRWGGLGEVKPGQRRISVMARLVGDVPRGDLPEELVAAGAPQVTMSGTGGHASTDPHSIAGESVSSSYATIFDIPVDQDVLVLEMTASAAPWRTIYKPWMDQPTGTTLEGPDKVAVTVSGVAGIPAKPDVSQVILATTAAATQQFLPIAQDAEGKWYAGNYIAAYKAEELSMLWFTFPVPPDQVKQRTVLGRGLHRVKCQVAAKPEVRVELRPYVTPPTQHVEPAKSSAKP